MMLEPHHRPEPKVNEVRETADWLFLKRLTPASIGHRLRHQSRIDSTHNIHGCIGLISVEGVEYVVRYP